MKRIMVIAALAAMSVAQPATADDWSEGRRLNVPSDQWKSPSEIVAIMKKQGYRVVEVESDDGAYEVEMIGSNGVRVETHVHPATGKVLHGYDD